MIRSEAHVAAPRSSATRRNPLGSLFELGERWLLVVILACSLSARPLHAQLTGIVTDSASSPIAGATVSLWRDDREFARKVTSADGRFYVTTAEHASDLLLVARAIAYQATSLRVGTSHSEPVKLVLAVATYAQPLATLRVRPGHECSVRDEPEARLLWTRMAAQYLPERGGVGRAADIQFQRGSTSYEQLGQVNESALPVGRWFLHASVLDATRLAVDVRGTYAVQRPKGAPMEVYGMPADAWYYFPIHERYPAHFLSAAFGARHAFALQSGNADDGWRLAFCPRGTASSGIVGTLSIARDTTLVRSEWRYRTPKTDEGAAAFIEYLPPRAATVDEVRPIRSGFWRRQAVGGGLMWRDFRMFRSWEPVSDSVARSPAR